MHSCRAHLQGTAIMTRFDGVSKRGLLWVKSGHAGDELSLRLMTQSGDVRTLGSSLGRGTTTPYSALRIFFLSEYLEVGHHHLAPGLRSQKDRDDIHDQRADRGVHHRLRKTH